MTGIDVELMLINAAATLGVLLQCEVRAQLMTGGVGGAHMHQRTMRDSFSAISTPPIVRLIAFLVLFRYLQDLRTFTPLRRCRFKLRVSEKKNDEERNFDLF